MANKEVKIEVIGGAAHVRSVPVGVTVSVFDYDTDGVDEDRISTDDKGTPCIVSLYKGWE